MMGPVEGLMKESIVDGSPLFDFIEKTFGEAQPKRALNIGITNILNGKF